jgi:hypothetical protein
MKQLLIITLAALVGFAAADAKPKKKQRGKAIAASTIITEDPFSYTEMGFYGTKVSEDLAYITSDNPDGVTAPLPFYMMRPPEMSSHEFRETIIFVVDNLSEASYK